MLCSQSSHVGSRGSFTGLGDFPWLALKHCPGDNGGALHTEDGDKAESGACMQLSICRAQSPWREGWGQGDITGPHARHQDSWVTCSAGNKG